MKRKQVILGVIFLVIIFSIAIIVISMQNRANDKENEIKKLYDYGDKLENMDLKPNTIVAKINGDEILYREIKTSRIQLDYSKNNSKNVAENKNAFYEVLKNKLFIQYAKKYPDAVEYDAHIQENIDKSTREWQNGTDNKSVEEYRKEYLNVLGIKEDEIWLNEKDFLTYIQNVSAEMMLQVKGSSIITKFAIERPELALDENLEKKVKEYNELKNNSNTPAEYMNKSVELYNEIRELYIKDLILNSNVELCVDKNESSYKVPEIYKEKAETTETKVDAKKEEEKKQRLEFERKYNEAINNLDKSVFLVDVDNYNPESNEIKISEEKAKEIAQKGFEESARRISEEGASNKETERVQIREESPNNYFTRYIYDGDKIYMNKKRKCYVITRENDIGNGISILVDVTTGIIIGGYAFGD